MGWTGGVGILAAEEGPPLVSTVGFGKGARVNPTIGLTRGAIVGLQENQILSHQSGVRKENSNSPSLVRRRRRPCSLPLDGRLDLRSGNLGLRSRYLDPTSRHLDLNLRSRSRRHNPLLLSTRHRRSCQRYHRRRPARHLPSSVVEGALQRLDPHLFDPRVLLRRFECGLRCFECGLRRLQCGLRRFQRGLKLEFPHLTSGFPRCRRLELRLQLTPLLRRSLLANQSLLNLPGHFLHLERLFLDLLEPRARIRRRVCELPLQQINLAQRFLDILAGLLPLRRKVVNGILRLGLFPSELYDVVRLLQALPFDCTEFRPGQLELLPKLADRRLRLPEPFLGLRFALET